MDNNNPIFRSIELIENHIADKLTVGNIASSVFISKHHYQRLFREIVGDSVMDYVTKRRLSLAGEALIHTNKAVIDIALAYGYDSREGFTRSFKSYMGITPSEYRKYGLAAISQKAVKERLNMTYSKTTDGIIRELNEFIAKMKLLAENSRKNTAPEHKTFWYAISENADGIADRVNDTLTLLSSIEEHPDDITTLMNILKAFDDAMFETNVFALHVRVAAARFIMPEHIAIYKPLCDKYQELAQSCEQKVVRIKNFFDELSSLIMSEMRKTLTQKINDVILACKRIAGNDSCHAAYIKGEITRMVNELSETPIESVTVKMLNDCRFNMRFIALAAKVETSQHPGSEKLFDDITAFYNSLSDAADFCGTITVPDNGPSMEQRIIMILEDIAYQANILLFYTKGEFERLEGIVSGGQAEMLKTINAAMENCVKFSRGATDKNAFKEIADMLNDVVGGMMSAAEQLGDNGNAVVILADTLKVLVCKVEKCIGFTQC